MNRPSDRMMDDDVNEGLKWRVWFGGDVQGLDSLLLEMEIVCLHSLKSKEARDCSVTVMKDIQVSIHLCHMEEHIQEILTDSNPTNSGPLLAMLRSLSRKGLPQGPKTSGFLRGMLAGVLSSSLAS